MEALHKLNYVHNYAFCVISYVIVMGLASSLPLTKQELTVIRQETGFSTSLLVSLHRRFNALDRRHVGTLSREDFMKIKKLANNPLKDRIIQSFFTDADSELSFVQFIRVIACFRPAVEGITPEEDINGRHSKVKMTFRMMDADGDGRISKQELLDALRAMMRVDVGEEELSSIADQMILEADEDGDGCIGFEEFVKMTKKVEFEEKLSLRFLVA